jgi:hypothetical protein
MLYDHAMSAIILDGRDPLLVEAVVTSRVHVPEFEHINIGGMSEWHGGYEAPTRTPVCIMDYRGGKIRKGDEAEMEILWGSLGSGLEGLQIGSPKGEVRASEVKAVDDWDTRVELAEDGAVAEPGYWMDLTSEIHLISPTKARPDCNAK